MTKQERRSEIREISDSLFNTMDYLRDNRDALEEIGCKYESKLLDTIMSKLLILSEKLDDKCR